MNAEVKVVFHVCTCPYIELDIGFISKLGTKNYICIYQGTLQNSIAKNILENFDNHLIMETLTDYSGFEAFFGKYLENPKETRVVAWIDEDVKICGQLREKYGIPGDDVEASRICDDKFVTKSYLRKSGVRCADFYHFKQIRDEEIKQTVALVEAQLSYPMFGKPTNLNAARCTEEIKSREGLVDYFKYTQNYPQLEFMIEQFLSGKHYQIEAIIVKGQIKFDMVMHYPNPCQSSLFGKPLLGDTEIVELLIGIAIACFMPYCQMRGANVIVDFFTMKASDRTKAGLDAFMTLVFAMAIVAVWAFLA